MCFDVRPSASSSAHTTLLNEIQKANDTYEIRRMPTMTITTRRRHVVGAIL